MHKIRYLEVLKKVNENRRKSGYENIKEESGLHIDRIFISDQETLFEKEEESG